MTRSSHEDLARTSRLLDMLASGAFGQDIQMLVIDLSGISTSRRGRMTEHVRMGWCVVCA